MIQGKIRKCMRRSHLSILVIFPPFFPLHCSKTPKPFSAVSLLVPSGHSSLATRSTGQGPQKPIGQGRKQGGKGGRTETPRPNAGSDNMRDRPDAVSPPESPRRARPACDGSAQAPVLAVMVSLEQEKNRGRGCKVCKDHRGRRTKGSFGMMTPNTARKFMIKYARS